MNLHFALFLSTALLGSSATAQEVVARLPVPVIFQKDGKPESRRIVTEGRTVRVRFEAIPGRVTGSADKNPIQSLDILKEDVLVLDGPFLSKILHERAQPLDNEMREAGLKIEPKETHLARLATFGIIGEEASLSTSAAFVERIDGPFVFAVYFDRKCNVRGKISRNGIETEYALDIPGKGIWFLRSRYFADKRRVFELAPSTMRALFVINRKE